MREMAGFNCHTFFLIALLTTIVTANLTEGEPPLPQFEAAFQGTCSNTSPCTQNCIQLNAGTYECGCQSGFELSRDGYSCIESGVLESSSSSESHNTVETHNYANKETSCSVNCLNGSDCMEETCICPLGYSGPTCESKSPSSYSCASFTSKSYLSLPPLSDAYIQDIIELDFNPLSENGVVLVTGERDDYEGGDYMAVLLLNGRIEFRFDCGSGAGVVRTGPVNIGSWNNLSLIRRRWEGWVRLNGGEWVGGRSEGLFSRITFRQPVYIGGLGNWSGSGNASLAGQQETTPLASLLSSLPSYEGLIRSLKINGKEYDFGVDSIKGQGLQQCHGNEENNDSQCGNCLHGGQCLMRESRSCLCPIGYEGTYCEVATAAMESPHFNGSAYLSYPPILATTTTWFEIGIVLKPEANDGIILYSNGGEESSDYISLNLDEGHVELVVELGSGTGVLRSPSRVALGSWHSVQVSRSSRLIQLKVDNQPAVEVLTPGPYNQLSLGGGLYLGGVPEDTDLSEKLRVRSGYSGCVQKLSLNSVPLHIISSAIGGSNLASCEHICNTAPCRNGGRCTPNLEEYSCDCLLGFRGNECGEAMEEAGDGLNFRGRSWLRLGSNTAVGGLSTSPKSRIALELKTTHSQGMILYAAGRGGGPSPDFLSLSLSKGKLVLRQSLGSGPASIESSGRMDDGEWHSLTIERNEQSISLQLDSYPIIEARIPGKLRFMDVEYLHVGGVPHHSSPHPESTESVEGLSGCLRLLTINRQDINILREAKDGRSLDYCE